MFFADCTTQVLWVSINSRKFNVFKWNLKKTWLYCKCFKSWRLTTTHTQLCNSLINCKTPVCKLIMHIAIGIWLFFQKFGVLYLERNCRTYGCDHKDFWTMKQEGHKMLVDVVWPAIKIIVIIAIRQEFQTFKYNKPKTSICPNVT